MSDVTAVLTALADPTRRELLDKLSRRGEATATALASDLPISRQAIAQHLAVLRDVDLVQGRRHGREHHFVVHAQPLDDLAKWMATLSRQWDHRLAALKQIAESARGVTS